MVRGSESLSAPTRIDPTKRVLRALPLGASSWDRSQLGSFPGAWVLDGDRNGAAESGDESLATHAREPLVLSLSSVSGFATQRLSRVCAA
jgi:hypothetical protein